MGASNKTHQLQYEILNYLLDYMESSGTTYNLVKFDADEEFTDDINKENDANYSVADIEQAVDKCLAHEWLGHVTMHRNRYNNLGVTQKGVEEAVLKLKVDGLIYSRPWPKKASDYISDHKGLFVFVSFLMALVTFSLKFLGDN
jgi:hypothetical protein